MTDSSLPNGPSTTIERHAHGITEIRQRAIGRMIAKGLPVKYVAKKLQISESRIYHLLSDQESIVNAEINRILGEVFTANDRYLVRLFNKTLENLDTMLSSPDKEKQFRAMDRIIKIYAARCTKNGVTVKQYFGIEPPAGKPEFTMDDYINFGQKLKNTIRQMQIERGLPAVDPGSAPGACAPQTPCPDTPAASNPSQNSSRPETSASNESSPDSSPSETAAPDESPRGYSPPDTPAEIRGFLDDMDETSPSG